MNKAVFVGRAGTIHNMPKNGTLNLSNFEIFPKVSQALNILGQQGYFIAVIGAEKKKLPGTDYSGIIQSVEQWITGMVAYPIAFKLCLHHSATKCPCRLPKPGLIKEFQSELKLDLEESIMIASREAEVKGAISAGIGTILRVDTGKGDWSKKSDTLPLYETLLIAVEEWAGVTI